jgi:hypothetical protein
LAASRADGDTKGFLDARQFFDGSDLEGANEWSQPLRYYEPTSGILLWEQLSNDTRYERSFSLLDRRAWVVQERYVARRTILFTGRQSFWKCRTLLSEESGKVSLNVVDDIQQVVDSIQSYSLLRDNPERPNYRSVLYKDHTRVPYELWNGLIKQYTSCALTKSTDLLPALAGIASQIVDSTGQDYYAGMLGGVLLEQLLWTIVGSSRLDYYRALSWAWASLEGKFSCRQ